MRILMIFNRYKIRAGEEFIYEDEMSLLQKSGHEVIGLDLRTHDPAGFYQKARFALGMTWSISWYSRLLKLLDEHRPEVVHVQNHFPVFSPSIYHACRKRNIPVVITLHNYRLYCPKASAFRDGKVCELCMHQPFPISGIKYACYHDSRIETASVGMMIATHKLMGTYRNVVETIIVNTEFGRRKFIEVGIPPEKLAVKPNGLYPDPGPGETGGKYALFIGRLDETKVLASLFEAWTGLGDTLPLKMAGSGPLEDDIRQRAANEPNIEFLGKIPREQVYSLMSNAAFLVFPSLWFEGMPMTICEAFALNTPVIASNIGAMSTMIVPGHNGLHFQPGDSEDLRTQVKWMLDHPRERIEMGENARKDFEEYYSSEVNYANLIAIYQDAIEKRRGYVSARG